MYNTGIPLPPQQTAPQGMQTQQPMQQPMQQGAQQQQPIAQQIAHMQNMGLVGTQQPMQQPMQQGVQQPMQQPQGMQKPQGMALGAQSPFTVPGMGNMMPGNQLAGGQNPFAVPGMGGMTPQVMPTQPGMGQPMTQPPMTQPPMTPAGHSISDPGVVARSISDPGIPSNPNVSMPIGPQPVTEGYGGMGGMGGGLMNFFQSLMNRGGGPRMGGFNMQDMMERMRSRQGDPRRDNLFQRYGAPPPPQQPGYSPSALTPAQMTALINPAPPVRPQLTPGQITALIHPQNPAGLTSYGPGPPMTPQEQEQHDRQQQLQKLQMQQTEQEWLQQHPGATMMPMS